jgi:hypothetical protein
MILPADTIATHAHSVRCAQKTRYLRLLFASARMSFGVVSGAKLSQ